MFFYVAMCALFAGIFIVRYHSELIFFRASCIWFLRVYLKLGLQADSPVQNPEKLFQERGFLLYMLLSTLASYCSCLRISQYCMICST